MNERIKALADLTMQGEMFVKDVQIEFDRMDLFLSKTEREVKQLCEYILAQEPKITEYSAMTGFFRFAGGTVVGDAFNRGGHKITQETMRSFYLKQIDSLSTMEWQHATADYKRVLTRGIKGIIEDIDASMQVNTADEQIAFLKGLRKVAETMILWAHKCSERARAFAETVGTAEYKANLTRLADALLRVPENAPENFYEALLTVYVCYSADPDSIGVPDRYFLPFYQKDLNDGTITREEAKAYLQELLLMLQAKTPATSPNFTRGGESHFCIGGYLPNGEDGFNDLSALIVEALVELPTYAPQITLRWTEKMPREAFRRVMDAERHDPNKRIAFTNDDKRIKTYTELCGFPLEKAVNYTTVGCNEPTSLGCIAGSTSYMNITRCLDRVLHERGDSIRTAETFDEFYAVFEKEMLTDLDEALSWDDKFMLQRGRDVNYITNLFFNDCIENATSLTQGGGKWALASPSLIGVTNIIDSLAVVKQFVFEEKLFTMGELLTALAANWEGYEDMRTLILKKGKFFGNDDEISNSVARRLYESFYVHLKDRKNVFGYPVLIGDLVGYNEHHKWYGEKMRAFPDGRHAGDLLKFGIGQSEGKDRKGLTALLNSLAGMDPHGIGCGATVTNVMLDEAIVRDDANFEKTVDLFEMYFKNGGVHFQLSYVSRDDLLAAKETPEKYGHLRVRVSGFSDYFVRLNCGLQNDIIARTSQK